ncbi:hypothetical protein RN001_010773 [Aquatica leii]|uniref:Uncharacterized protein n=1 Tax=Aquatica leii TaxID=1421715 RepID=A0AAN7SEN6_9COLE|nr:hypothetical protein RN001_010773 [Aquatica leii]
METERESEAYLAMVEKLWKELNEKVQKYIDENQTEKAAVMSSEEVEKEPPKTNVVRKREDSEVEDEDYSMQADEPVEDDFSVESSDEFDYDMAANAFLEMLMQLYESNH